MNELNILTTVNIIDMYKRCVGLIPQTIARRKLPAPKPNEPSKFPTSSLPNPVIL
jgi:hypothetical protein